MSAHPIDVLDAMQLAERKLREKCGQAAVADYLALARVRVAALLSEIDKRQPFVCQVTVSDLALLCHFDGKVRP